MGPFGAPPSQVTKTIQVSTREAEVFRERIAKIIETYVELGIQGGDPAYWDILKPLSVAFGKDLETFAREARARVNMRNGIEE